MKRLQQVLSRSLIILLCLTAMGVYGQKQTKTYKETFNVGDEAVLDINTSHADIEFETWNKNQVVIEAVVEIEGVSEEEAEKYFENGGVKIVGNSSNIEISTGAENTWFFNHDGEDMHDFQIVIPDIPDMPDLAPLLEQVMVIPDFPELLDLPPMPPMHIQEFDHEAYKRDGDKYLEKWKKEFETNFDDDYQKKLEEWSEKMESKREEIEIKHEIRIKEHEKAIEKAEKQTEKAMIIHEKVIEKAERQTEKAMMQMHENNPNIFYYSTDGEDKNLKVKKTIKIKMPKSAKLKMNVRHGEVKLAENTKNINATLSYARLLASTIEGDKTSINASYSPVSVQKWNYGQLKTDYSDKVDLKEVTNLSLSATSSDVTIERLLKNVIIKNNFGVLRINSVAENFTGMDISLKNAELLCKLPSTAFNINVNGTDSVLKSPASLTLDQTKSHNNILHKGYNINKNSSKTITINSKYSEVVLE